MKKLIITFIIFMTALSGGTHAQEPPYAVTFSTWENGQQVVYVATFDGNTWQVVALPESAIFNQFDINLIKPVWSDGKLYVTLPNIVTDDVQRAVTLAVYDPQTEELTRLLDVLDPAEPTYEGMKIESISPDGHYALVGSVVYYDAPPYLVDLTTGSILWQPACEVFLLHWGASEVVLSYSPWATGCEANVSRYDLLTGEVLQSYPTEAFNEELYWANYPEKGQLLEDGQLLAGSLSNYETGNPSYLGLFDLTSGDAQYFGLADAVQVSGHEVSYLNDLNQLMRLDLTTGEAEVVTEFQTYMGPVYWVENTLHFWEKRTEGEQVTISKITLQAQTRTEQVIYSGATPTAEWYQPQGEALAVFTAEGTTTIYNQTGILSEFANTEVTPSNVPNGAWVGDWLSLQSEGENFLVNVQTGEEKHNLPAGMSLVSTSPDQVWWLYSVFAEVSSDQLVAWNMETGEQVTLIENVDLAERNFHWSPDAYYVWSE